MTEVGARELKSSLSRYLRRVREGESIVVTDRGEPIARIIPVGIPEGIAKLMAEGESPGPANRSGRRSPFR